MLRRKSRAATRTKKRIARRVARSLHNGVVLWEGPSALDGNQIAVIATGIRKASANPKTGPMVQVWILRADVRPDRAVKSGADASVCGGCKFRPANGGGCYVKTFQAPLSVWKSYRAGQYPAADGSELVGKRVRLGAYGDPGAVPASVWTRALEGVTGWTGYTHQWRHRPDLKALCMASVDDAAEAAEASALGWRYFRVRALGEAIVLAKEIECVNTSSGKSCYDCGLCKGATLGAKSIYIDAHGAGAKRIRGSLNVLQA
jgi:hypothetical protein